MFEEWRASPAGAGADAERSVEVPGSPAALAGEDGVTYRARLPSVDAGEVVAITLEGIYAHAEVSVGGTLVGGSEPVHHDTYFAPLHLPVRPDADGELVVTCEEPHDRFGGIHDTDLVAPDASVPGIWWTATAEAQSLPYVADLAVSPTLEGDTATLTVRTTVVTDGATDERVTYSVRPAGEHRGSATMERGAIEGAETGLRTVEHTIELRDPARWWPAGLGDQHRYTVRAKLGDSERSVTTGVRDVERDDGDLVINGKPVRIRGVNLVTADTADVERARALDANLVRGHAQVLPPAVYEACDEAGLLVWQDLPLTGPGPFDVDRGRAIARRLQRVYGRHPSLAVVTVHDDPSDTFADGLGNGVLDGLRLRWRAWRTSYDRGPADAVAEVVDQVPTVPVVGSPGTAPDAAAYYAGWDYGQPADILDLLAGFPAPILAEYGATALASESASPSGSARIKHDRHVGDGPAASQAYQAALLRTVTGAVRRDGRSAVAFALRDAAEPGMGVYDRDGDRKAGGEALAQALAPVQAFLTDPSAGPSDVAVVNDGQTAVSATVNWTAGEDGGTLDVDVPTRGVRTAGTVDVPSGAEAVDLETAVGDRTVKHRYEL